MSWIARSSLDHPHQVTPYARKKVCSLVKFCSPGKIKSAFSLSRDRHDWNAAVRPPASAMFSPLVVH